MQTTTKNRLDAMFTNNGYFTMCLLWQEYLEY
jgi:hypothetical protein